MDDRPEATASSGNIFRDLGFADPEAEQRKADARLARVQALADRMAVLPEAGLASLEDYLGRVEGMYGVRRRVVTVAELEAEAE